MAESLRAESGRQVLARLSSARPDISDIEPTLFPSKTLKARDVVELRGGPGSGKTALATHLLARCILSCEFGGMGAGAIFINTDHHFQLTLLVAMLERFLMTGGCSTVPKELKKSLQQLVILSCYDSSQLAVTLHALPQYLSARSQVALLMFDSPTAFYWADALAEGNQRLCSKQIYLRNVIQSVLSPGVCQESTTLIYTVSDSFIPKFKPNLPANATFQKVSLQVLTSNNTPSDASGSSDMGGFLATSSSNELEEPHIAHFTINCSGVNWLSTRTTLLPHSS